MEIPIEVLVLSEHACDAAQLETILRGGSISAQVSHHICTDGCEPRTADIWALIPGVQMDIKKILSQNKFFSKKPLCLILPDHFDLHQALEWQIAGADQVIPWAETSYIQASVRARQEQQQNEQRPSDFGQTSDRINDVQLRENEFLSAVLQTIGALVLVIRRDGSIVGFNKACEYLSGYSIDEIRGKNLQMLILPEEMEGVWQKFQELFTDPSLNLYTNHWIDRQGKKYLIEWRSTVLRNLAGEIEFVVGTGIDVTQRAAMEQENREWVRTLEDRVKKRTIELQTANTALQNQITLRNQVEQAHTRLAQILWETPDVVAIVDLRGRLSYLNKRGRELLHVPLEGDVTDKMALRYYPQRFRQKVVREGAQIAVQKGVWSGETILTNAIGEEIEVSQVIIAHIDGHGKVDRFSTIARDITQLKKAEAQACESEARLRSIIQNMLDLFSVTDENWKYQYINPAYQTVMGYSPYEIIGKTIFDFVHPDDLNTVLDAANVVASTGNRVQMEYRFRHHDAHYVWVESIGNIRKDDSGNLVGGVFSTRDMTDRKQMEDVLRDSKELYQSLAESSPDLIYLISQDGIIEYLNHFAAEILSVSVGTSIIPGNCQQDHPLIQMFYDRMAGVLSRGVQNYSDDKIMDGDKTYWYGNWMIPIRKKEGQFTAILGVTHDITSRKESHEELQRAYSQEKELNELRSRFIAMTSHEFRTPLATILSSAELLEHYSNRWSEDKKKEHYHRIQNAVGFMRDMMEDVLVIGKAESGIAFTNWESCDAVELCQMIVKELMMSDRHQHPITLIHTAEHIPIQTDPTLFRQIIGNLLTNAIKYSSSGSPVEVNLEVKADSLIVTTTDHGIGIPESEQIRIFEPFYRGSNIGDSSGTGLGLAVVHWLLQNLGGNIETHSQTGYGSTFVVTLPLRDPSILIKEKKVTE